MEKVNDNELAFSYALIYQSMHEFKTSVYRKLSFNGQHLNIDSLYPYSVNKGIFHYLQHQANVIGGDTETYEQVMISISNSLQHNNKPGNMTAAPTKGLR